VIRVIGLGQAAAGDDAVGLHVVRALEGVAGVEGVALSDAAALIEWLDGTPIAVVDAVIGEPGAIHEVGVEALARTPAVSTHGIGLVEAVGLARALEGDACADGLTVFAIGIEAPRALSIGLSPEVAAAVPRAVERVRAWIGKVQRA
jgi:hydrogenase maturation protease